MHDTRYRDTRYIVSDVMTHTVVALRPGAAFKDIVKTMRQWDISALPVVDDDQRVVGVVSEADLLRKEEVSDGGLDAYVDPLRRPDLAKAAAVSAGELMTTPPVTVPPDATLAQAARTMARGGVKRLPVVDGDGVLKGIVSRSDLLKVFLRDDRGIAEEIRREVVAHLFDGPYDAVEVEVRDGVVTLTGRIRDTALVPVAVRLVRSVEGVVDVDCALAGPRRQPNLDPDLPQTEGARPA
ncbi:CBS domain-containing protein [Streptomyces sp. NPDC005209]|uniref:CBS domain-containing protein n=1 Tax=Streptomyces sp. NPDC005209 TaxID=3156715 RepID=UPI0033B55255